MNQLEPELVNPARRVEGERKFSQVGHSGFEAACADNSRLAEWVLEAVRNMDAAMSRPSLNSAPDCCCSQRTLLALIVYCYAAGAYASEDVEVRLARDGIARIFCGLEHLDQTTILRFRKHHASVIVWCLARTLACAFKHSHAGDVRSDVSRRNQTDAVLAVECDPVVLEIYITEAQRRVGWAMFLDSMAHDD